MKKYTFKKGKFNLTPGEPFQLWQPGKVGILQWTVQFDETCRYIQPHSEQEDWLKGGGVTLDLLSNHKNAVMWAWRYNPDTDKIELALYAHKGGDRYFTKPLASVAVGITFTVRIFKSSGTMWRVEFDTGEGWTGDAVQIPYDGFLYRRLPAWFGGTLPAPQDVNIYMDFLKS